MLQDSQSVRARMAAASRRIGRLKRIDRAAVLLITLGGVAVVVSVLGILLFIGAEAVPLFMPARLSPGSPLRLETATAGVEQNRPMSTPGVAKRADSPAIARSQVATSWQPAAVATPCTRAITGCGIRWIRVITFAQHPKRSR